MLNAKVRANISHVFQDPQIVAAAMRVDDMSKAMDKNPNLPASLSISQLIFHNTDIVLVLDAALDRLLHDDYVRSIFIEMGGVELLGQMIVQYKVNLNEAQNSLVNLKTLL